MEHRVRLLWAFRAVLAPSQLLVGLLGLSKGETEVKGWFAERCQQNWTPNVCM